MSEQQLSSKELAFDNWIASLQPYMFPASQRDAFAAGYDAATRAAHEPFHSPASEPSAANSGQCESRKTAQSGTGAGLSPPPPADLSQYIDILPTAVDGEPNAHRLQLRVGVQSFPIGPDYLEDREHAEWYSRLIVIALNNAIQGTASTKSEGRE